MVNGRLFLQGTLPLKDGSPGRKQQRIALGIDDTAQNRRIAEKRLKLLERELAKGTFSWADWTDVKQGISWRKAIDLLYRKKVINGRTSQATWDVRIMGYLRKADLAQPVTTSGLQEFITRYDRSQAAYKDVFYLCKTIAQLSGVVFPDIGTPLYGAKGRTLDVPDDSEIIHWVLNAGQPYQWAFGCIATYGLRPHELTGSTFDGTRLVVPDETKTGYRVVIPLHADWVAAFDLLNVQPLPASVRYEPRPDELSQWLNKRRLAMKVKWTTRSLRNAYAGRLWRLGGSELDVFTAARLMGHSPEMHTRTYRAFISGLTVAGVAEAAINRNLQKLEAQALEQMSESELFGVSQSVSPG